MAVIYLHGFNGSSKSHKATVLRRHLQQHGLAHALSIPDLAHDPRRAVASVETLIERVPGQRLAFVGSSLGGFYAAWLAERHDARAVLINPAMRPFELLGPYVGQQVNPYTGEAYQLCREHLEQLRELGVKRFSRPQDVLLLVQTGDEVIDYRQTLACLPDVRRHVIAGGSHAFEAFENVLDEIVEFCRESL